MEFSHGHSAKYFGYDGVATVRSLLIGCGNSREKKVRLNGDAAWKGELTTLDMNESCGADLVFDMARRMIPAINDCLHNIPWMPFPDETFDEMGAYDVLEHWGAQGDWRGWFTEFAEYHRILKPGGQFGIIVPIGQDAFADPGHTRFIHVNHFKMLNQEWYEQTIAAGQPVTDYRWYWKKNFNVLHLENVGGHHLGVVLEKA